MRGEFALIEALAQAVAPSTQSPFVRCGIGDDAAWLSALQNPIISTDAHYENVHFRRDWQSGAQVGFKAVQACLSDLAASLSEPRALFVNLSIPATFPDEFLLELYAGIGEALRETPAVLAGGNVTRSLGGLGIDLFAIGEGSEAMPQRGHARVGDIVCVTGFPGLAAAGLDALQNNRSEPGALRTAFLRPHARFDVARVLARHAIGALMDVSDGLAGDTAKIATASRVTIAASLDGTHIHPELGAYCAQWNLDPFEFMCRGGEEYELLFTCAPDVLHALRKELDLVLVVGNVVAQGTIPVTGVRGNSFDHRA